MKLIELQKIMNPVQKIRLYDKNGISLGLGYVKEIGDLPYHDDEVFVITSGTGSYISVILNKVYEAK